MGDMSMVELNISQVKYDDASKSIRTKPGEKHLVIDCRDALHLSEKTNGVAPFFLLYYRQRHDEFSIVKALKIFTVFVDHEGVPLLKKYENLVKKMRDIISERPKMADVLLCLEDVGEKCASHPLVKVLREAGVDWEMRVLNGNLNQELGKKQGNREILFTRPPKNFIFSEPIPSENSVVEETVRPVPSSKVESCRGDSNVSNCDEDLAKSSSDSRKNSHRLFEENEKQLEQLESAKASLYKSWRWTFYLIPAFLIALLAIGLHLMIDRSEE